MSSSRPVKGFTVGVDVGIGVVGAIVGAGVTGIDGAAVGDAVGDNVDSIVGTLHTTSPPLHLQCWGHGVGNGVGGNPFVGLAVGNHVAVDCFDCSEGEIVWRRGGFRAVDLGVGVARTLTFVG
jgi:hypothetical protein